MACQSSANEAQDLLCIVCSVLRIVIFPHTIVPESTTVASFAAQLRFDEDEDVDLYPAWNRLDEKETRQQQTASICIIGTLGRTLSRGMSMGRCRLAGP